MSLSRESREDLLARVGAYYASALDRHGATARGVDWSSEASQRLRFDQLARLWENESSEFSLMDYGCGYGALVPYLRERGVAFRYTGFDISPAMVAVARQLHEGPDTDFLTDEASLPVADYGVASGIFNVRMDTPEEAWLEYVLETLDRLDSRTRKGFAFNVLSRYSDQERRRADLFYADPLFFFDHCKTRFSRSVALLHDYPLYEFTLFVRKDP
jgi:SAM-dependent methyltransferase